MKKQICIPLLFMLLLGGMVRAQGTGGDGFTLKECIELGLKNNAEIKKSILEEQEAKFLRKEIIGSGLPQLEAYGNYNNFIDVYPQAIPGGILDPNSDPNGVDVIAFGVPQSLKGGFKLNQLVFSQSYLIGLKAAKTSEEFYQLVTNMTTEDIIYDIALNYYGVIATELQMINLEANHDKLVKLESIIKSQYENDLARKVDFNRVKVNLTSLETEIANLETLIEQRSNYLKLVMGIPVISDLKLKAYDFDEITSSPQILASDPDLSGRYDLQVLDKQQELQSLNIKNIKSGYYPTIAAFADLNYNAFSNSFDFLSSSHQWYRGSLVGIQLNIPIFDGNQRKYKVAQAKIQSEKLRHDQYLAEQNAQTAYLNAFKKMKNSLKSLEAQQSNLLLSETVFDETNQLYREGLSPLTDVLDSETALREARAAYFNQIINVKTAEADLYQSTGQIEKIAL
ncbi:TolC family protein [uncultured Cyclobacterium sp.]|uniref:TolC family protein n=1 Tax=uncultured Cyclobacterium sp. TaxID=453820 RepID=UPI0030EC352C|tara:strand:+ start:133167 stop:134528 length:1362 start_codon:yes stop_codon:yes gene_type:complete